MTSTGNRCTRHLMGPAERKAFFTQSLQLAAKQPTRQLQRLVQRKAHKLAFAKVGREVKN